MKYKVSTIASEEPGGLNESLEVCPVWKDEATSPFLSKGHWMTLHLLWSTRHISPKDLVFGKKSHITILPSAFPGEQTGSHSEGQVNNCLTAQAKIGEITLVGGSTTVRTGLHPFSLPLSMLLAASVSPCFLLSCQPSLSRQGNRSTQFPRIETYTSPSAPRLAAAAFGSCYPSRTGKMQWREEAHVPHRFRKELSSSPGEQNASPPSPVPTPAQERKTCNAAADFLAFNSYW